MEASADVWFLLSALTFTILAGVVTGLLFRRKQLMSLKSDGRVGSLPAQAFQSHKQKCTNSSKEEQSDLSQSEIQSTNHLKQSIQEVSHEPSTLQEQMDGEFEKSMSSPAGECMDGEDPLMRYMPGMMRTSHLKKMMSKDELEEEQRVQRDQLAAIFKLLKENQETFGEVTEKDMEEQLKLYSI